jgi:acetyl-CoA synthetase
MMNKEIREVASRIRTLREVAGMSEQEAAAKTEVSLDEYRALELGERDFPFTFIYKAADTFGVEMRDILEGTSPNLSLYTVTRKGDGMPIARNTGFVYNNLAPSFKHKNAEPFWVSIPPESGNEPPVFTHHNGQEIDIVIKGKLEIRIHNRIEILTEGDTIYYNSSAPHALRALGGKVCEIYAIVIKPGEDDNSFDQTPVSVTSPGDRPLKTVCDEFIDLSFDQNGIVNGVRFKNAERFNFAFDVVDRIAEKTPDKRAMLWVGANKRDHSFTFGDMSKYSNMTANYFASLGIKKGDRVMLVLKRHYQFWFCMLALHKLGAIAIPATNQLVLHDFEYRYESADVTAIVCTADGETHLHAEAAAANRPDMIKILVGGKRDGWFDYNSEMTLCSDRFPRTKDSICGEDPMIMLFTSGTSGYPRIATHSCTYPLGHYITARCWHSVHPDGLHFTVSDTGWGKALWGKLYGQWLCEAPVFTYDFDRFNPADILPLFEKYRITTFCAPPTIYRYLIREDLSKYNLSSIVYATTAGEALNPEVSNIFYNSTGLRIMEAFGQTETTLVIGNFMGMIPKPGSMGKPSPLYKVALLNPEGKPCEPGEPGEICIDIREGKPCGLFLGYFKDKEGTDAAMHDGFYHTGDTATIDEDGYFWYIGRIDDVIKSSGYRIGPFEIESVIMELPYVLECAVTAVPDEIRGQIVKATIILTKGTVGTDALKKEIQNYVKTHTAPYKYPRVVEFTDELPKTISGKVRRFVIRNKDKDSLS